MKSNDPERLAQDDAPALIAALVLAGTICLVLWHEVKEAVRRLALWL